MKKIITILIAFLLLSCKSKQPIAEVPIRTDTRVTERVVEVQLPADSAWLTAWLECDSTNQVILKKLSEKKSPGVFSDLKLQSGKLDYYINTIKEPQKVAVKDSIIYKEIPVKVEVQKIEYRQTGWQKFTSKIGTISLISLLVFGAWIFIKWKF